MIGAVLTAALALGLAGEPRTAPPQTPPATQTPPSDTPTRLGDVVVEGRSLDEAVRDFVGDVTVLPRKNGLARWPDKVCVAVANIRPDGAQYVADRVSQVALDLGLEPGDPGCRPNIIVLFTHDGRALASDLVGARRHAFHTGVGGMDRGRHALDQFRTSDAPIRWWHVILPTDSETNSRAVRLPGDQEPPTIAVFAPSRLNANAINNDFNKAVIIVDVDRMGTATFEQITDYVAMVALAEIDPDADTSSYDTVLNVFDNPDAPARLTEWDMSYLRALYGPHSERANPRAQASSIAGVMSRDRQADEAEPAH